ncbi:hypothetical protein [Spirillospora sp. CA-294931]|uniref:hypothetical protein n=1 Tax=Spirillospora sp. CA-294931 TaxID=3240042 RepID=UPI003D9099D4
MFPYPMFRACRALAFATVCVALATTGHALTSTAPVPGWAVGVAFCGVLAVALGLSGHERSLPTIFGGLLFGQFAVHSLYAGASGASPVEHHVPSVPSAGHGSGAGMTLAHVVAAVVAAWWLRRGERTAWSLVRRAASLGVRPLLAVDVVLPVPRPCPPPAEPARPVGRALLRHQVVRRGPPARSRRPAPR